MPAARTARMPDVEQPYPGLRPFDVKDSFLFFGREQHTQELLDRLSRNRFLAVVGTSGSGKSSLVRAGLMPALYRGYLVGATSRWRIAVMRPGNDPINELAKALASQDVLAADRTQLRDLLRASSLGLTSAVRSANLAKGESLLLVVDQFEELFRFASESRSQDTSGEALLFINLLLEAVDQSEAPIYVALTMRTDFLGDCPQFPGLPEALNRSQYLIPRMSREQRRQAIERPIEIADAEITPRLVQQLLNEMGDDPDQLPIMQHALARTFRVWKARRTDTPLDLDDYEKAGSMTGALDKHAQGIYDGFSPADQVWTEKLFRTLTKMDKGREIRRPRRLERILRVSGAVDDSSRKAVQNVIDAFASPENSLLVLTPAEKIEDTIVDISHESLIRKWDQLSTWVKTEAESADLFSELLRAAARQKKGQGDYWSNPQLSAALKSKSKAGWTDAWAEQYGGEEPPGLAGVEKFLTGSIAKERLKRRMRYVIYFGVVLLCLLGIVAAVEYDGQKHERKGREEAEEAARKKSLEVDALQATLQKERAANEAELSRERELYKKATTEAEKKAAQTKIDSINSNIAESLKRENSELSKKTAYLEHQLESMKGSYGKAAK